MYILFRRRGPPVHNLLQGEEFRSARTVYICQVVSLVKKYYICFLFSLMHVKKTSINKSTLYSKYSGKQEDFNLLLV